MTPWNVSLLLFISLWSSWASSKRFYPRRCTSLSPSLLDWTFLKRSVKISQYLFSGCTCIGFYSFCLLLLCFLLMEGTVPWQSWSTCPVWALIMLHFSLFLWVLTSKVCQYLFLRTDLHKLAIQCILLTSRYQTPIHFWKKVLWHWKGSARSSNYDRRQESIQNDSKAWETSS